MSYSRWARSDGDIGSDGGGYGTPSSGAHGGRRGVSASRMLGIGCRATRAGPESAPEASPSALMRGSITGSVSDDRGGPLAGAMVSALGATMAMTVSDARGLLLDRRRCPLGDYIVQAHLTGFAGSRRETVRVGAASPRRPRVCSSAASTRRSRRPASSPVAARPIMAAGFELPGVDALPISPTRASRRRGADDHPHTETAWRLRHIKRSILKDVGVVGRRRSPSSDDGDAGRLRRSAARSTRRRAWRRRFFTRPAVLGRSQPADDRRLRPGRPVLRRLRCRAAWPTSRSARRRRRGDWSVRAAMSQGDLSSWIVAGAFESRANVDAHATTSGSAYSHAGIPRRQSRRRSRRVNGRQPQCRRGLRVRQLDGHAAASRVDYGGRYAQLRLPAATAACSARALGCRSSRSATRA